MSSRVTEHMVKLLSVTLDEADMLGLATWGGVENIKTQSVLDNRKSTTVSDLTKLIRYLTQLREDVEALHMVESDS